MSVVLLLYGEQVASAKYRTIPLQDPGVSESEVKIVVDLFVQNR